MRSLWRGGLPPFGCEAVAKTASAMCLKKGWGSASHSNGGKPPRHKSSLLQGIYVMVRSRATCGSCRSNPRPLARPSAPGRTGRNRSAGRG
ncbi:hypothetical protein AO361_24415 [Pseudomonas fluorescens]|nr:hypothetical protein AO361_24415 [Pseudomonas fluorescens]